MNNNSQQPSKLQYSVKELYPRIFELLKTHKRELILGLIALALGSGINLFFPYFIRLLLNGRFGFSLNEDLGKISIALILLFAVQALFFYFRHYFFYVVGYKVVTTLRNKLFAALMAQDVAFFDSSRVGDLLSRLSSDTNMLQRAVTRNISVALRYLLQVVGGIGLMLYISVKLSLVIILLVPVSVIAGIMWGKRLRSYSKKMQEEIGEATVIAEESVGAAKLVKIFAGGNYEVSRYARAIDSALRTGIARTKIAASFSSSMVFLLHSSLAIILWYGGYLTLQKELTIGDLTGFLLYGVIVSVSFAFLANVWDEFMQALGAADRVFEIIDHKPHVLNTSNPVKLPSHTTGTVCFQNVCFSYPSRPQNQALHNISFKIPEGSSLALVGPSGAGKSTIASLIPRFYDPDSGVIRYCDIDLRKLDLEELRTEISVVQQNPQVFSLSIGDNIHYGRLDASEEEIIEAAKAANIHDFIMNLPKGYDTPVGDRGVQLSGGEKQRVAVARAILKNPKFLILDEATSALDSENEYLVQQALERLMVKRSTLIIAHRLSTVQNADKVLVIKEGQISQSGSHSTLLKEDGLYKTLVAHQLL